MKTVSVHELKSATPDKSLFIDVRSPGEYAGVHKRGAINIPLDRCSSERVLEAITQQDAEHVYLICQSGSRASMACEKLQDCDFADKLIVVEGGTTAWQEAGGEVIKGKGTISIERQVRIAAGFLVALGAALGYWVHPGYLGISAFVGVGLMFAGITDFCGMGLVLAKMPWNTKAGCTTGCAFEEKES
jgi:rhodanese-related sulfurtransferase